MVKQDEWYKDWFNSPYYHILYQNRDREEALRFINNLVTYLKPAHNASFLDLACGKGRHALQLAQKGYRVIGVDIAPDNIREAAQYESDNLSFFVWDMRKPVRADYFDYVLNLFTSFGYFDDEGNCQTLRALETSLQQQGIFVIDYLNTTKATQNFTPEEDIRLDGIDFHLERELQGNYITKTITVVDQDIEHVFQESVKTLRLKDFQRYFERTGFEMINCFGDYDLNTYDELTSDRLILIARKP